MSRRPARIVLPCALALWFAACALSPIETLPATDDDGSGPEHPSGAGGTALGNSGGDSGIDAGLGGASLGGEGGAAGAGAEAPK